MQTKTDESRDDLMREIDALRREDNAIKRPTGVFSRRCPKEKATREATKILLDDGSEINPDDAVEVAISLQDSPLVDLNPPSMEVEGPCAYIGDAPAVDIEGEDLSVDSLKALVRSLQGEKSVLLNKLNAATWRADLLDRELALSQKLVADTNNAWQNHFIRVSTATRDSLNVLSQKLVAPTKEKEDGTDTD